MGCFSMSCNLSNLSIYNDEIAVMLIKKNRFAGSHISKNSICSNDGSSAFYEPYSPLIYGECDTYGNIEEIDDNEAFKWTCQKLGIEKSEQAFHNYISNDWMEESKDDIAIAFFNKAIVNKAIEYQRNQDSLFNHYCQHWILEKFPQFFSLKETLPDTERYNLVYSVIGSNKLIQSDGKWIHSKDASFFRTSELLEWINNDEISHTILTMPKHWFIFFIFQNFFSCCNFIRS